ncbi:hypothetical protein GYM62_05015 [Algoriphagus sp. NBT04N3]|uniref:hypothetical protein n=1 Tax=Algoriphagus sp. NBT04N3 TaxID=2705473 RepID=UPI001C6295E8|nr:hypothetical protein [Algoriphagus sp. NBT04N3]QYH38188.1 hypothetical protein GYM62_05015 [Algoriphagus sp. NBT04N3]
MIPTEINYHKEELFDSIAESSTEIYLWELLQAWMIFLSQRDLNAVEVSNRLFFFELLDNHLQKGREEFDRNRLKNTLEFLKTNPPT